jgi:hypothetical protein
MPDDKKPNVLKTTVHNAIANSAAYLKPELGELFRRLLPHMPSHVESHLAIESLAYLNRILTYGLSESQFIQWEKATRSMTAFHATENISDDLFVVDSTGRPRAGMQAILRKFMVEDVLPLLPHVFTANTAHLDRSLASIDRLDFSGYDFPVEQTADYLMPQILRLLSSDDIPADVLQLLRHIEANPVNFFLKLNLISIYNAAAQLTDLNQQLEGRLSSIHSAAYNAMRRRYQAGQILLEEPFLSIENAFEFAIDTILVTYSGAHNALAHAIADSAISQALDDRQNQEQVIQMTYLVAADIRCTNDIGLLLHASQEEVTHIVERLRHHYGDDLAPRMLFRTLFESQDMWTIRQLFSRQIKDAVDNEYNLLLNAGASPHLTADEFWTVWFDNLHYSRQQYGRISRKAASILREVREFAPSIVDSLATFAYFNYELYSQPAHIGDYDTRFDGWRHLESLRSDTAWQSYFSDA